MVAEKYLRLVKMVKFGFFPNIFDAIYLSLFFIHITLTIFRMYKSLIATYTFSHKIKVTYLTAKKNEK